MSWSPLVEERRKKQNPGQWFAKSGQIEPMKVPNFGAESEKSWFLAIFLQNSIYRHEYFIGDREKLIDSPFYRIKATIWSKCIYFTYVGLFSSTNKSDQIAHFLQFLVFDWMNGDQWNLVATSTSHSDWT